QQAVPFDRRSDMPSPTSAPVPEGRAVADVATAGVRAVVGRAYGASRSVRTRLRFAGALVLLVIPLLAAAWAVGNYAAANERSHTDARLGISLQSAASEYKLIVNEAQLEAMQLATNQRVQRA